MTNLPVNVLECLHWCYIIYGGVQERDWWVERDLHCKYEQMLSYCFSKHCHTSLSSHSMWEHSFHTSLIVMGYWSFSLCQSWESKTVVHCYFHLYFSDSLRVLHLSGGHLVDPFYEWTLLTSLIFSIRMLVLHLPFQWQLFTYFK